MKKKIILVITIIVFINCSNRYNHKSIESIKYKPVITKSRVFKKLKYCLLPLLGFSSFYFANFYYFISQPKYNFHTNNILSSFSMDFFIKDKEGISHRCNMNDYEYTKKLYNELLLSKNDYLEINNNHKWTTNDLTTKLLDFYKIDSSFFFKELSKNFDYFNDIYSSISSSISINRTFYQFYNNRKGTLRIKLLNNSLYYKDEVIGNWYTKYYLYYIKYLQKEYSSFFEKELKAFDILLFIGDVKHNLFDWKTQPPIFTSDAHFYKYQKNTFLHFLSRDYICSLCNFVVKLNILKKDKPFKDKINKIYFVGSKKLPHDIRDSIIYYLNYNNDTLISNFSNVKLTKAKKIYSDFSFCNLKKDRCFGNGTNILNELNYRYHLVLDGSGARDSLLRQMQENAIIIKPNNTNSQWFYYDLKNYNNSFIFNNKKELLKILKFIIEKSQNNLDILENIAKRGSEFARKKSSNNENDCFALFMLKLYNNFFFNNLSVKLEKNDTLIDLSKFKNLNKCPLVENL